jgi:putative hydrolase of the HAD superfamily
MPATDFDHVDAWVFDLDNTLYPYTCDLFPQVDRRIRRFIANTLGVNDDEARRVQRRYFHAYGTSLLGLTREHGTDPGEFLAFVHDVDLSAVTPNPALGRGLDGLPGRKFLFTNADTTYATRVLDRLGVGGAFDAIFDIAAGGYVPKPHPAAYERLLSYHDIEPGRAALFEDLPRNLAPAAALGMTTVWVRNDAEWAQPDFEAEHGVDHVVDELGLWLYDLAAALAGSRVL